MDIKRTKIICSIGPSSENLDTMLEMVYSGMNVARINFSHGNKKEYELIKRNVENVRKITGNEIGILYDTKGPDLRVDEIENGFIELKEDSKIKIFKSAKIGNKNGITFNYNSVVKKLKKGNIILLNDGLIELEVISTDDKGANCKVKSGGKLASHKSAFIPGVELGIPFLSNIDKEDIKYACKSKGDFIALSFVSSKKDVLNVRKILNEHKSKMQIISKIENKNGLDNIDEIIDVSDGIMVARGDLGVEMPMEKLPILQKEMIQKCRSKGKICIVATEMLASMENSPRPTRAEVSDVANAVLDGCDAVMLSGETTIGKHPIETVKLMADICNKTEDYYEYDNDEHIHDKAVTSGIAKAVLAAIKEIDVKAVAVPTMGGHSAKIISNLRPNPIVIAPCPSSEVARRLSLCFGVIPVVVPIVDDFNQIIDLSIEAVKKVLDIKKGDYIIITGGIHKKREPNQTNFLKIEEI